MTFLVPAATFLCPLELDFLSFRPFFDGVIFGLLTCNSVDMFSGLSIRMEDSELKMMGAPGRGGGGAQCSKTSLWYPYGGVKTTNSA